MAAPIGRPIGQTAAVFLVLICSSLFAAAEPTGDRQAICQANWENCLGTAEGKNWKLSYDRCLKMRSACLKGQAFTPEPSPNPAGGFLLQAQAGDGGNDTANADPATRAARCDNGPRGERAVCTLAPAGEGYGQSFSLLGPGVPLSRMQRASSVVKCAGGRVAGFYPNGRIESCTLDNDGGLALTDTSGHVTLCGAHSVTRFDPEGRLLSCDRP
ncbi:MAG TPA: hypothetical protein VFI23_00830 [Rhizomicrobium sp.]|nr:hypothetical protein [Rhizomicrobium sp.]